MARASNEVISILRRTAGQIRQSPDYQWGHMGACNCGFLAQQVTGLSKAEIHRGAMQGSGDWNEQLNDYCPTSGLLFDNIISALLLSGFDSDDLKKLENLSDPEILSRLSRTHLNRSNRDDVSLYLETWAAILEERLTSELVQTTIDEALNEKVPATLHDLPPF